MDASHTFTKPPFRKIFLILNMPLGLALLFYREMSESTENGLVKSLGLVIRSKGLLEIEPNIQASSSSRMLLPRAGGVDIWGTTVVLNSRSGGVDGGAAGRREMGEGSAAGQFWRRKGRWTRILFLPGNFIVTTGY